MLSAGQLSLHVSQVRNVHTVPCSHVHLCHPLEDPECTTEHWLHTAGAGHCPLENPNPVFTPTQWFWVTGSADSVDLWFYWQIYLPGRKPGLKHLAVFTSPVCASSCVPWSQQSQDMENELNRFYAQKSVLSWNSNNFVYIPCVLPIPLDMLLLWLVLI